jgi:hypothetical protein
MTSSSPSPPTLKLTMGSTIPLTAKILTKYLPLGFVEDMSTQMFAVVASITLRLFSRSAVPSKRRQLGGTTNACYATQIAPFLVSWKLIPVSICGRRKTYRPINYLNQFKNALRTSLESLRSQAAAGGPDLKFAAGSATAPNFQRLYAFVQCTPDLSKLDCNNCLVGAFQNISLCCDGKQGGRVTRRSYYVRFDIYPFYNPTNNAASPRRSTNITDKREGTRSFIIITQQIMQS